MAKSKKVKVNTKPNPRETADIIMDTRADTDAILDLSVQPQTTEASLGGNEPQGSTRNDLTITFRYNFDRITRLKEFALQETKENWAKSENKKNVKTVQYTDLMRRAIDEKYFGA